MNYTNFYQKIRENENYLSLSLIILFVVVSLLKIVFNYNFVDYSHSFVVLLLSFWLIFRKDYKTFNSQIKFIIIFSLLIFAFVFYLFLAITNIQLSNFYYNLFSSFAFVLFFLGIILTVDWSR